MTTAALNRIYRDERVPLHLAGRFYDVARFKEGRLSIAPDQIRDLSPVAGKQLVHLQCHFGLDTLSWARLGADVTGLDFSRSAIAAAQEFARDTGLAARFVEADVYDAPRVLQAEYDIVYTGIGALTWLPDIASWAGCRVVSSIWWNSIPPNGFSTTAIRSRSNTTTSRP